MKAVLAIVAVLFLSGADGCNKRSTGQARIEAERMTGRPMVCDGSEDNGYVCFDGRGGAIHCPSHEDTKCAPIEPMMPKPCAEAGP